MKPLYRILLLIATCAATAGAQTVTRARPPETQPWRFKAGVSFNGDSNINHEHDATADYGAVPFFGTEYYRRSSASRVQFIYDIGLHRYARTEQWNRVSHYARGSWRPGLTGRWTPKTEADVSIKGTSEDRDLSNRYTLRQELAYEIAKNRDLTFYGAYRRRDYKDNGRDSHNPYAGLKYEQKLAGDREWSTGARWELNDTRDPRARYRRATFDTDYAFPASGRGKVELGLTYRPTWYTDRTISRHSTTLRRDNRLIAEVLYDYALRNRLTLQLGYNYETRSSNEADKGFDAHLLSVTFRRNW